MRIISNMEWTKQIPEQSGVGSERCERDSGGYEVDGGRRSTPVKTGVVRRAASPFSTTRTSTGAEGNDSGSLTSLDDHQIFSVDPYSSGEFADSRLLPTSRCVGPPESRLVASCCLLLLDRLRYGSKGILALEPIKRNERALARPEGQALGGRPAPAYCLKLVRSSSSDEEALRLAQASVVSLGVL